MVGKFFASLLIYGIVNGCGSRSARGRGSDDKPARGPTYNQRHSDEEQRGSVYESARGSDVSVLSADDEFVYIVPVSIPSTLRKIMNHNLAYAGLHLSPRLFETYIPGAVFRGNEIPIYLTSQTKSRGEDYFLVARKSLNGVCQRTEGYFMFGLLHSNRQKTYVTIITSNIKDEGVYCDEWGPQVDLKHNNQESLGYVNGVVAIQLVVFEIIKSISDSPLALTSIADQSQIRIRAILVSRGRLA
jgi:hypothetical protein